jgi:Integrase core domain
VDNGAPFASQGPGGLSKLSVWWIGLGIEVQFSRPACPQDNGCHERMHRTMKAECCRPPSVNGYAQQQRFDRWRKDFNEERPHEGLGMRMPADVYHPSAKRLIGLEGGRGYVGEAFIGVDVALERSETSDLILVRYANVKLGQLDTSAKPRLLPAFSDKGWETKPIKPIKPPTI